MRVFFNDPENLNRHKARKEREEDTLSFPSEFNTLSVNWSKLLLGKEREVAHKEFICLMELHFVGTSLDNLKVESRAVVQNEDIRIVHTDFRKKEKLFSYVRHGSETQPKTVSAFSAVGFKILKQWP